MERKTAVCNPHFDHFDFFKVIGQCLKILDYFGIYRGLPPFRLLKKGDILFLCGYSLKNEYC